MIACARGDVVDAAVGSGIDRLLEAAVAEDVEADLQRALQERVEVDVAAADLEAEDVTVMVTANVYEPDVEKPFDGSPSQQFVGPWS